MPRIVYGIHPVEEALKAGKVQLLFAVEDPGAPVRALIERARASKVAVLDRSRRSLDELTGGALHQGAVAAVGDYQYQTLAQVLDRPAGHLGLVIVLDGVQDPQNLGALIRSAHVAGVDGVLIPRDRAAAVTAAVVKASAGATEHVRLARVTNLSRALDELKAAGLWTVGAVATGGEPPWKIDFAQPVALVLGAEGSGIRPLVERGCDLLVQIPMVGQVASFNVGAAGAILLYEVMRQRARK